MVEVFEVGFVDKKEFVLDFGVFGWLYVVFVVVVVFYFVEG